jgi:hypothetical protein
VELKIRGSLGLFNSFFSLFGNDLDGTALQRRVRHLPMRGFESNFAEVEKPVYPRWQRFIVEF